MLKLYIIIFFAFILSGFLGFAQYYHLFNGVLYRCEGFGCIGAGIIDLLVFLVSSFGLAIVACVLHPQKRVASFMMTLGISLFFNMITISVLGYLHKADVYQNMCKAIELCKSDPNICTWELEESTRQSYPKCFNSE